MILLMSLLVGLEVALQFDKDNQKSLSSQSVEPAHLSVRIDSKVLVDNLADALNTIDLAVASALEVKNRSAPVE